MRNLFVCCDGTWNSPDMVQDGVPVVTNVYKFYNAINRDPKANPPQEAYYHPGVGTGDEGGPIKRTWNKWIGGAFGSGLERNILSAYEWLCNTYLDGAAQGGPDRIYMVGFSRGAFTVRSLAGLIWACGLIPRQAGEDVPYSAIENKFTAYKDYKKKVRGADEATAKGLREALRGGNVVPRIEFLGVWDTVGALGIPDKIKWLNWIKPDHKFNDTGLNDAIGHACHALAMDERRSTFTPTLWTTPVKNTPERSLVQTWFPGAHADVGGGYKETELSDVALSWMFKQAKSHGAVFRPAADEIEGSPKGVMHDSAREMKDLLATLPRALPPVQAANQEGPQTCDLPFGQRFHANVLERQTDPPLAQSPFWPTQVLQKGDTKTFEVFAKEYWTPSGVYLLKGETYQFKPVGTWQDGSKTCGAGGYPSVIAWFWRKMPRVATLRDKAARKMALVGVTITPQNPTTGGDPAAVTPVFSGDPGQQKITATGDGYLYCYPNDVRLDFKENTFYKNNRGKIRVTVTRVS